LRIPQTSSITFKHSDTGKNRIYRGPIRDSEDGLCKFMIIYQNPSK
jgi:hypothetical protein